MRENTGKVVLVGAGPGDTGLLTLKGEKYIKQADCLVYDRLSSPEFLSMAKAGCELIYVANIREPIACNGKECRGNHHREDVWQAGIHM